MNDRGPSLVEPAPAPPRAGGSRPASVPSVLQRYRQIAAVLIKYGLVDVVGSLHLRQYLAAGTRLLPHRARVDPTLSKAARFRLTLEALGPTFVKLGQALSVRGDVLPAELVGELSRLQDQVTPLEPGVAETVVEAELGAPVTRLFRWFDPVPLAAASMAQVHRAELPDGTPVAVKVRRPGIAAVIASDLEILRQLARLVERHLPQARAADPRSLVEEFARSIRVEQDLVREGRHLERAARQFAADPTVCIPRVHWPWTRPGVLTMDLLDGTKVGALLDEGLDPGAGRLIARRGADALLKQILVHGFFHADPHPGNLMVLPGGVIGFLDFGIVGRLDRELRAELVRLVRAVRRRDAHELADVAMALGRAPGDVDTAALARELDALVDAYADRPLGELSMTEVLTEVVATAARHQLRMPVDVMLLIKALMTIEGVGRRLDPSFQVVRHAAPLAERVWRREHAPRRLAVRGAREIAAAAATVRQLPGHLESIVRKARDGRLQVQFVHRNLEHFVTEMDRSSNRLSFAVVIGSIIVASALVIQAGVGIPLFGYPLLGLAGFVVAGVLGIGLALGIARSGRL